MVVCLIEVRHWHPFCQIITDGEFEVGKRSEGGINFHLHFGVDEAGVLQQAGNELDVLRPFDCNVGKSSLHGLADINATFKADVIQKFAGIPF